MQSIEGVALLAAAWAANIDIGSGIRVDTLIRSMKDLRDKDLVRQRLDFSCGATRFSSAIERIKPRKSCEPAQPTPIRGSSARVLMDLR